LNGCRRSPYRAPPTGQRVAGFIVLNGAEPLGPSSASPWHTSSSTFSIIPSSSFSIQRNRESARPIAQRQIADYFAACLLHAQDVGQASMVLLAPRISARWPTKFGVSHMAMKRAALAARTDGSEGADAELQREVRTIEASSYLSTRLNDRRRPRRTLIPRVTRYPPQRESVPTQRPSPSLPKVVEEYIDRGESARSAARPALQGMLSRITERRGCRLRHRSQG